MCLGITRNKCMKTDSYYKFLRKVQNWANFQTRPITKEDKRLTAEACQDKLNNCREFGHDNICPLGHRFNPWAAINCAKFCGFCVAATTLTTPTNNTFHISNLYVTTTFPLISKVTTKAQLHTTEKMRKTKQTLSTTTQMVSTTTSTKTLPTTTERVISPVMFHAQLSTRYSIMSPRQVIVFDDVISNIGHSYDDVFRLFKVPYSGLYEFIVTVSATKNHFVDVSLVNNIIMLCNAHASSPDQGIGVCVAMVHTNKDDDVFVKHYNGIGTHLSGAEGYSSFSGHLIYSE